MKTGPCAKQLVIAVIVNGREFWVGTNYCKNAQEVCPREGMKTGEGYELCREVCLQEHHAEIRACLKAGEGAAGATLYLIGHYYACESCMEFLRSRGVEDVVVVDSIRGALECAQKEVGGRE